MMTISREALVGKPSGNQKKWNSVVVRGYISLGYGPCAVAVSSLFYNKSAMQMNFRCSSVGDRATVGSRSWASTKSWME
eukprot:2851606-Karenia_brevis.AAC.1